MAEAVFLNLINNKNLESRFKVDSAGLIGYHAGESPDERTVRTCLKHDVPIKHFARKIIKQDFLDFNYILCMDNSNLRELMKIQSKVKVNGPKAIVKLFGEYDPLGVKIIEGEYQKMSSSIYFVLIVTRCSEAFLQSLGIENELP
ncbi:2834_t:CDS:2 [Diversispora eburnea]|uniref:2834_t:CDS:1 n=1 Tax=Diversispora eburnea TaxID=1213867 RepID=A0A9N9C1A2_9GLOM|nr:2834_t:CDS:2 [Diversispora eburnea]